MVSTLAAGVFFAQNGLIQTKNIPPKIDSISPSIGRADALVTIRGSGFSTEADYEREIGKGNLRNMPYGNYIRIAGDGTMGPPSSSPDGKTVKFRLALSSDQVPQNCKPGVTGPQCQINLQVVNGEGIPSNIVPYQLYFVERPLVLTMELDSQTPAAQNIQPGDSDVEVLRYKIKSSAENPINFDITQFTIKTMPTYIADWDVYCKDFISNIKLVDASTGELLSSYPSFPDNLVNCETTISTWLTFPPREEKTFKVLISAPAQAKAGLQFKVVLGMLSSTPEISVQGSYEVTSNLITITP